MLTIVNHPGNWRLELTCVVCNTPFAGLAQAWLALPRLGKGARVKPHRRHRGASTATLSGLFGTSAVTLMFGSKPFRRLAETLKAIKPRT
jgi:hypothetical protein